MDRVKKSFSYSLSLSLIIMGLIVSLCQIFPADFIGLINDNELIIELSAHYLSIYSWGFLFMSLISTTNTIFTSEGLVLPGWLGSIIKFIIFLFLSFLLYFLDIKDSSSILYIWIISLFFHAAFNIYILVNKKERLFGVRKY